MGERARPPLALVELAPFESSARGAREVLRELQVVVAEAPSPVEEHDREPRASPGRLHGHGQHGAVSRRSSRVSPFRVEAVVVRKGWCRDHEAVARTGSQRLGDGGPEEACNLLRQAVLGGQLEPFLGRHQQSGGAPAERFGGGSRNGAQRLRLRDGRRKQRSDVVEGPLDPRLPRALVEALGIAKRERRERRERFEQLGVRARERALGIACADTEDAPNLVRPHHRRDDRPGEARIRVVGNGHGQVRVGTRESRRAAFDRLPCETAVGGELEADELRREAVHRGAAERPAHRVEQVAIGRFAVEQPRHLVDEPLEHGLELELARDDLRGAQQ